MAPPPWRKLLWVKQPYPDNYVDASFLSQLKRNLHVQQYSFWTLASDSAVIIAHMATVALFISVFIEIYARGSEPLGVAAGGSGLTLAGFLTIDSCKGIPANSKTQTFKSAFIIVSTLLGLSPVLKSLTQSTASDSIWAVSFWLLLANVYFHDYSSRRNRLFPPTLSTNLALSAAIVLASRLPTTMGVFSFLLFSIELFGLFPVFLHWLHGYSYEGHLALTAALVGLTEYATVHITGRWGGALWALVVVTVAFVGPGWLIVMQRYKNEIQGPWDPAKPVLRTR
ncbi:phosphatidylinositol N-acetylglucosaminyltransferase subunit C [Dipodascopsis tothii]|uniref:phosphatidylinositol N-acetylglucosaminyltransferase subunit C n=1 Tax=Dipodascopsis tothii TaxID=44089 RepID=UPI0034CFAB05